MLDDDDVGCRSCQFWYVPDEDDTEHGQCRRNPPVPRGDDNRGVFPVTSGEDYCAEWVGTDGEPYLDRHPLLDDDEEE